MAEEELRQVEKGTVLIVDDDAINREILKHIFSPYYTIEEAENGAEGLHRILTAPEQLCAVLLDVVMPKMDGIQVLEKLRRQGNALPVLLLTARDSIEDRVRGLDAGADDYLVKPFAFEELLARLRVLLRKPAGDKTSVLQVGDLQLRLDTRQVFRGGQALQLYSKEFSLLRYMMQNAGIVLSRDTLEQHVWDYDYSGGSNVIDVYIRYLRRKIDEGHEKKYIHTVRGCGYVLKDDAV